MPTGLQHWGVFAACVLGTTLVDALVFGRGSHRVSFREATAKSVLWVSLGLLFTLYVYFWVGAQQGTDYLVAYLVEKSLSVDNLFVFLVVFSYFQVRDEHQPRILSWGIIGALVMRAVFILLGTTALHHLHWTMYLFGGFLIYSGGKLAFRREESMDPENNYALKFARRYLRTSDEPDGDRFFTRRQGQLHATPLFLVLVVIEATDVVFAVDSVPAVLAISNDIYVVYTSNILAILGLRALYFMLSGVMRRFHHLDKGLAVVLAFVGVKMVIADWYKIPNLASLGVIALVLAISITASLLRPPPPSSITDSSLP